MATRLIYLQSFQSQSIGLYNLFVVTIMNTNNNDNDVNEVLPKLTKESEQKIKL